MKSTPRKPAAKALHAPVPELQAALAMPEKKRRKGKNDVKRTGATRGQGGFV